MEPSKKEKTNKEKVIEIQEKIFKTLTEGVRKNHKSKTCYKILVLPKRLARYEFQQFNKYMKFTKKYNFSQKLGGFIVEEMEYTPDNYKDKKTPQQMQEEFLEKKTATKLKDGGVELSDIERKSKSYRDSTAKEREYLAIYDGVKCRSIKYDKIKIEFSHRKGGSAAGQSFSTKRNSRKERTQITYYKVIAKNYTGCILKQRTIEEKFKSGEWFIEKEEKKD